MMTVLLVIYSMILFTISACDTPDKLHQTTIYQGFPLIDNKGHLMGYERDSILLYQKGGIVGYRFHYLVDTVIIGSNGQVSYSAAYPRYRYYFQNQGDKLGYLFDSDDSAKNGWYPIDSMLHNHPFWMNTDSFYSVFKNNNLRLQSSTVSSSGNIREEYSIKSLSNPYYSGILYLEFTKKNEGLPFTLCKELDSVRQMKLVSTKLINHRQYLPSHDINVDEFVSNEYAIRKKDSVTDSLIVEKYLQSFLEKARSRDPIRQKWNN